MTDAINYPPAYCYQIAHRVVALMASEEFAQTTAAMELTEFIDCMAEQVRDAVGLPPAVSAHQITDHAAEELLRWTPAPVRRLYARLRSRGETPKAALTEAARYLKELKAACGDDGHD